MNAMVRDHLTLNQKSPDYDTFWQTETTIVKKIKRRKRPGPLMLGKKTEARTRAVSEPLTSLSVRVLKSEMPCSAADRRGLKRTDRGSS